MSLRFLNSSLHSIYFILGYGDNMSKKGLIHLCCCASKGKKNLKEEQIGCKKKKRKKGEKKGNHKASWSSPKYKISRIRALFLGANRPTWLWAYGRPSLWPGTGMSNKSCQARLQKYLEREKSGDGSEPNREIVGISLMSWNSNWWAWESGLGWTCL